MAAEKAVEGLNGCEMMGNRIRVRLSSANTPRSTKDIPDREVQDCYYYQILKCERQSQCPFLHRTLPQDVCKLFMFGKCRKGGRCSKQHLAHFSLPLPSDREVTRLASLPLMAVKLDKEGVKQFGIRKMKSKSSSASTGAIRKARGIVRMEKGGAVPDRSAFECLDCGVTTTSCLLLESHLNTEEHWNRVKQMKVVGEEIRGVLGDRRDTWCEVCGVRVNMKKMEKHKKEELHMHMLEKLSEEDWNIAGDGRTEELEDTKDIHVSNIPHDMTRNRFQLVCLQFGEVTKLKMLPMSGDKGQHAYVRYSSQEGHEFAAIKLKKLQKIHFAGASNNFIEKTVIEETSRGKEETGNTKKILVQRFVCNLCDVVCNSDKQLRHHMISHMRRKTKDDEEYMNMENFQQDYAEVVPVEMFKDRTVVAHSQHYFKLEDIDCKQPHSSLQEMQQSQVGNQLDHLTMAKEERESQLIFCQNQLKMCKLDGTKLEQTLKLLEEELDIQRKLKDLEIEEQTVKEQLASSLIQNPRSTFSTSSNSSGSKSDSFSPPSFSLGSTPTTFQEFLPSRTHLLPDDVFYSDDDEDEDSSGSFLQGQEPTSCPVKERPDMHKQIEELNEQFAVHLLRQNKEAIAKPLDDEQIGEDLKNYFDDSNSNGKSTNKHLVETTEEDMRSKNRLEQAKIFLGSSS